VVQNGNGALCVQLPAIAASPGHGVAKRLMIAHGSPATARARREKGGPAMLDPKNFDPGAYVAAVAPAVGLQLSAERQLRVAEALALVVKLGAAALSRPVPESAEPAAMFRP
jgi:hypothetical protein